MSTVTITLEHKDLLALAIFVNSTIVEDGTKGWEIPQRVLESVRAALPEQINEEQFWQWMAKGQPNFCVVAA